jgi:transcriptional regulator with XRE-family HTH domain
MMDWNSLSNNQINHEIGKRIKQLRLQKGITQKELAEKAGISLFTVSNIEKGNNISLHLMIAVLRVLKLINNFELLFPEIELSPLSILKLKGNTPKRIKKSKL